VTVIRRRTSTVLKKVGRPVSPVGRITPFLTADGVAVAMAFDEDDRVVLHDPHSDYDGETGTVTQKMDTMFGEPTYTVSFDDGQEQGVSDDMLEPAAESEADDADDEE